MFRFVSLCMGLLVHFFLFGWQVEAFGWQDASPRQGATTTKIPVNRDTWISSVEQERLGSNGGASRLKLKSYQEMSIVDFDSSALKGRVIERAFLHLHVADKKPLLRISTSSVSAEWVEGNATGYGQEDGASTFQMRKFPDVPWSYPGSDVTSVILGSGNSWWNSSEPSKMDENGWQSIEVSRDVVGARVAGLSDGILVFDDVGSEWKRTGDKFEIFSFPNRYFFSRQQNKSVAPYFTFELGAEDRLAPKIPTDLVADSRDLPSGEVMVQWTTPADEGPAGTLGFVVNLDGKRVPFYLVPKGDQPGNKVQMHVRDLGLAPTQKHDISVAAIDRAGNVGPVAKLRVSVSDLKSWSPKRAYSLRQAAPADASGNEVSLQWPRIGNAEYAVIDELDKVNLTTGALIPNKENRYWVENHLWSAKRGEIKLAGAKKEWIALQLVVRDSEVTNLTATLTLPDSKKMIPIAVGRYAPIVQGDGLFGDPIVPVARWGNGEGFENKKAKFACFHLEMHLPADLPAGLHQGKLSLRLNQTAIELTTKLQLWDLEIPNELSFLPEMNSYGLPQNEMDYYRLAHRHRTVLNRLPYHHNGRVSDGCAPKLKGNKMDWAQWDERFSPLLTGEAFADLERGGVPIECFYLPLFENWPIPIEPNYTESYWAEEALSDAYREQFEAASSEIAAHIQSKNWDKTLFHFYLNGKNNFKERGWSRSTCPWILDEPAHYQDFDALRWFGQAFQKGSSGVGAKNVLFRTDVSRPEWQREVLDGLVGYAVVSSAVRRYPRHVLDRARKNNEKVIEYGTSNRLDQPNIQPEAWCVDAWSLGLNGVLPWQTIGNLESWKSGDELSLFYPDPQSEAAQPIPSVRLKAYRRGQQNIEYLELLRSRLGVPHWMLRNWLRETIDLKSEREGTGVQGAEDAGRIRFQDLSAEDFAALRRFIAQAYQEQPAAAGNVSRQR